MISVFSLQNQVNYVPRYLTQRKKVYIKTHTHTHTQESNPNTTLTISHQITREENKRGKKEKRPTKTNPKQLTKWQ